MSANVETMFYTREKPWHGLGTYVSHALSSREALVASGLDWNVVQKDIYTENGISVDGFKANIRDSDNSVLGIVTDRYKVVQNSEAFAFTDELLGKGIRYETAGSLQAGRKTWINSISMIKEKQVCNFDKLTYTIPEVSELLNISVSQAYKLANQNTFPTIRLGKRILVSVKKLEEFINQ